MNTHYGIVTFSGDPDGEHPDPALRGTGPSIELIAAGDEEHCWQALARWTEKHPLGWWQEAEVVARDPSIVRAAL